MHSRNKSEKGASIVEFVLLLAMITIVAIAAVKNTGTAIRSSLLDATTAVGGSSDACIPGVDCR